MNPQVQQFLMRTDQVLRAPLLSIGKDSISLLWIIKLILTLATVIILASLLKRVLKNQIFTRLKLSEGHREALSTLISYSAGALCFVLVLQVNGLNLAPLLVALGGLGVGIGFGLQEVTKNLVSGLTLLVESKLQVGDYVEFDGLSGYIKEISVRSTIIRTFDGGDVIVPNSNLTSNRVLNWSYKNLSGKIRLAIQVAYESDPILVTETLLNSAYMEASVLHEPPPKVIFKGFGENALEFELWAWIAHIDEGIAVKSSLNFIIDYNLRQAGLKIPFPQRDLWLRNPEVLQTALRQDAGSPSGNGATPALAIAPDRSQAVSIRELLRQLPLFNICSDLHLRELIEAGYRKTVPQSATLFKEGEMGHDFYIILTGKVETIVTRLERKIKLYEPGDMLGEVAVMLGVPYLASAYVLEETNLFVVHKSNFDKLLRMHPSLAEAFANELAREQEVYAEVRQQLQELGLLDMANGQHQFVEWLKARFKQIFGVR